MADHDSSTLRTCKHCKIQKPLDAFVARKGGYLHKCKACRSEERRALYAARAGEYADWGNEQKQKKRREANRRRVGKYVWQPEWLNERPTKICTKCSIELPANPAWFRLRTNDTTGLQSWCRSCEARDYDAKRAERHITQREYYRRRMQSDPDAIRRNRESWKNKNRDRLKTLNKFWRERNIERERKRGVASEAKRRAQKRRSPGEFKKEDIDAMLASQNGKCWYCSAKLKTYHVDHRIPLARGGTNEISNLVIACPPCNLSKGAKMPWELKTPRLL